MAEWSWVPFYTEDMIVLLVLTTIEYGTTVSGAPKGDALGAKAPPPLGCLVKKKFLGRVVFIITSWV